MSFDIFISFRGKDTRNTFVGYLYNELVELGISTFMDDKKLLIGDSLSEELIRAIEESWSWIVVLSKNYASSKWCLRELTKIIDCMAEQKHRVLPVFYHVNPYDVRHQSGSFEESFRKHKEFLQELSSMEREKYLKEIEQWRKALTKVGDLSGVVVTKDSVEVASVEKTTKQLFDMLHHQKLVASDRLDNLVDIKGRLCKMDMLIGLESNERVKHIKGIVLNLEEKQDELELEANLFKDMKCLKILEIGNVQPCGDFRHLSKLLRLLNWHNYPSQCLPLDFESRYLFELFLPVSQTKQLWKGLKGFEKLKVIDVSDSKNLRETPNFTKVPNLESLVLSNCTRLCTIDPSISRLKHLVSLDLTCCISLRSFSSIENCKSLTTLKLVGSGLLGKGMEDSNIQHFFRHVDQRNFKV